MVSGVLQYKHAAQGIATGQNWSNWEGLPTHVLVKYDYFINK